MRQLNDAIQVKMVVLTAFCYTMRDITDINNIVLTCIIYPLIYLQFVFTHEFMYALEKNLHTYDARAN